MTSPASPQPAGPPGSRLALATLLLLVLVSMVGFGVVVPLLPFYAALFDAGPWKITLLFAGFSAGQFVGEIIWGQLSDRIGRRPVMIITIVGAAVGYLMLALAPTIWLAVFSRIFCGFFSGNLSTIQSYIVDITPRERLAGRLGLIGSLLGVGFVVGPTLGGLLARPELGAAGFQPPLLAAAGLSGLAAVGVVLFLRETRAAAVRDVRRPTMIAGMKAAVNHPVLPRLLASTFMSFMGVSATWSVLGLWGHEQFGWGPRAIGLLLAVTGVATGLCQGLFSGMAVRRLGAAPTLVSGLGLASLGLTLMVFPGTELQAFLLLTAAMIGHSLSQAPTGALIAGASGPDEQGSMLGANAGVGALARVAGPTIAGLLYSAVDSRAPFIFAGAILAVAAYFAWRGARTARA